MDRHQSLLGAGFGFGLAHARKAGRIKGGFECNCVFGSGCIVSWGLFLLPQRQRGVPAGAGRVLLALRGDGALPLASVVKSPAATYVTRQSD